jgi:stage V sporulation protein G
VATITFDDSFVVHDIRIIEGENGLFVAMPSKKTASGGFRDIAHPIHGDMRKMIEDAIVEAYNQLDKEAPTEE